MKNLLVLFALAIAWGWLPKTTAAAPPNPCGPASIYVVVPTTPADVWINGFCYKQVRANQHYLTTPLFAGCWYRFVVRARWQHKGRWVMGTHQVFVQSGQKVTLRFGPRVASPKMPPAHDSVAPVLPGDVNPARPGPPPMPRINTGNTALTLPAAPNPARPGPPPVPTGFGSL